MLELHLWQYPAFEHCEFLLWGKPWHYWVRLHLDYHLLAPGQDSADWQDWTQVGVLAAPSLAVCQVLAPCSLAGCWLLRSSFLLGPCVPSAGCFPLLNQQDLG